MPASREQRPQLLWILGDEHARSAEAADLVLASSQVAPQAVVPAIQIAEIVGLVHQHRTAPGVFLVKDDPMPIDRKIHVPAKFFIELRFGWRGNHALRQDYGT